MINKIGSVGTLQGLKGKDFMNDFFLKFNIYISRTLRLRKERS